MARITFMRSHRFPSGRLMVFKRLKNGDVFLMINGVIKAQAVNDGRSILAWRIAQKFNRLSTRYPEIPEAYAFVA